MMLSSEYPVNINFDLGYITLGRLEEIDNVLFQMDTVGFKVDVMEAEYKNGHFQRYGFSVCGDRLLVEHQLYPRR